MTIKLLARWDLHNPCNPKGTALPCDGTPRTSKIVFPEPGYAASQLGDDVWECAVERDTLPEQPRRGALIVRPLRAVTWGWIAVGPEVWGAREVRFGCLEYPGLSEHDAPARHHEWFIERERRNVPWRVAVEKQRLWTGSLWSCGANFFDAFGEPIDLRAAPALSRMGEGQVVLVYSHGEKVVETRSLAPVWPITATGEVRRVEHTVDAEFSLKRAPSCCFWDGVGSLGGADAYSPPYTTTRYEELDGATRDRVLALLRASASTPEDMARACWQQHAVGSYRGEDLDAAWDDLAALHAPGGELHVERYLGQVYHAESSDGYRPAGSSAAWCVRERLHVGGRAFVVSDVPEPETRQHLDVESERRRLIAEHWRQIDEALACHVPELPAHSSEILGIPDAAWVARYRDAWTVLVDDHRRVHAARAAAIVRAAQLEAEWEAFCATTLQVEIADDATELPPVVDTQPLVSE